MQLDVLSEGLLDALETFDTKILPLGLYASDALVKGARLKPRYHEWHGVIFPFLRAQGCTTGGFYPLKICTSRGEAQLPDGRFLHIIFVKFSNVKVLQFGSGYHVDQQAKREQRWTRVDLKEQIRQVCEGEDKIADEYQQPERILLFAGFDKTQRPFEQEFAILQEDLRWERERIHFSTRLWQDKAKVDLTCV